MTMGIYGGNPIKARKQSGWGSDREGDVVMFDAGPLVGVAGVLRRIETVEENPFLRFWGWDCVVNGEGDVVMRDCW